MDSHTYLTRTPGEDTIINDDHGYPPRLAAAMKDLPEPMASVIKHVYGDHLSLAETATRLDLSVSEVSRLVNEALDQITDRT